LYPIFVDNKAEGTKYSFVLDTSGEGSVTMRRSLRKIDTQEAANYSEAEQLFTVASLDEARQRLLEQGLDPASYCFFTWMRDGVRYYRVWEDKKVKEGIVRVVPFGQEAARLKRADSERLYTVAKRHGGQRVKFSVSNGLVEVLDGITGECKAAISVPLVGGSLILEPRQWSERQVAHFLNALLVRGLVPDAAYEEAEALQETTAH